MYRFDVKIFTPRDKYSYKRKVNQNQINTISKDLI